MLLVDLMEKSPEMFREGIKIASMFGEFPTSRWNGGRFNQGDQCNAKYIRGVIAAINGKGIPIRYTYTNPLLTEADLSDEYCNFCMQAADNGMNEVIVVSDILEEYHCTKQILIYQVPGLSSPAISGLIHPVILLPDREYSDQDLRFIFMHELNHYLHHDLWKIFFWELVVCIYWWNPLSYMIRRLIKDTAEYANDIRLTKDRDELTRTNYMLSLLNTSKQTHTFHTLPTLHFQEGTILNIEKRCDLISDSPKIRRNLFSQFIHIGSISLLFTLSLCFIFQPSSPAPNYDNDGTVIFDKPDSSNSFYIKRKDGKGYDLYVKHEDAFINTGIIENPEDYKNPKIYSSKKEATKFYENIK